MRKRLGGLQKATDNVLKYARYIAENKTTLRATAKVFNMNFSTLGRQIEMLLPEADPELYKQVRQVLVGNGLDKHLRGGDATHSKWKE